MGRKLHVTTANPFVTAKRSFYLVLKLIERVPNKKCLQGHIEDAIYCNDEYGLDSYFFEEHLGGKRC